MSRATYANVASTLALVVALGGTSYAAGVLPKGSVGTQQLKTGAVTSAKVKDRSLLATDFKAGQLPRGAAGPAGPAGPFTSNLPTGKTLRGDFYVSGNAPNGQYVGDAVSWGLTVDPGPVAEVVQRGAKPTTSCPGTFERPEAAPGRACFYVQYTERAGSLNAFSAESDGEMTFRHGALLYVVSSSAGFVQSLGTWAVTAP